MPPKDRNNKPKPPPRVYAEPDNPAFYTTIQKYLAVLFVVLAVGSLGFCVWLLVDGHSQQGTAALVIPVACFIMSRLVPRGWRGGPLK